MRKMVRALSTKIRDLVGARLKSRQGHAPA
jgi:hypothetical protein